MIILGLFKGIGKFLVLSLALLVFVVVPLDVIEVAFGFLFDLAGDVCNRKQ